MDEFTKAYLECCLWAETDNTTDQGGEPLDRNYDLKDFAPESLALAKRDCAAFQEAHGALIVDENLAYYGADTAGTDYRPYRKAGHDLWLTRSGHGAGFWDGDWEEPAATVLTAAARALGECPVYVGDDGLHFMGERP